MNGLMNLSFWLAVFCFGAFLYLKVGKKSDGQNVKNLKTAGIVFIIMFLVSAGFAAPGTQVKGTQETKTEPASVEAKSEEKEEKVTEDVPFETQTRDDNTLTKGTTKTQQEGAVGKKVKTYKVTLEDGKEVKRELVSEEVTVQATSKIVLNGTYVYIPPVVTPKVSSNCDPNYSGACVPIASDVDCAGGSGNGPAYVRGPVTVIGTDIYGLDSDHDGKGCE